MGKMPPTQAGPKALPLPAPAEQPFQETATPAPVKVKKKEQEETKEMEESILKCSPHLEEVEGKSQVALSDPISWEVSMGDFCLGLVRGLRRS